MKKIIFILLIVLGFFCVGCASLYREQKCYQKERECQNVCNDDRYSRKCLQFCYENLLSCLEKK